MAGQFIDRGGKVHDLEDVSKITFVDRDGNAIYEGNYGDTITYQQDGQTKTKKLTETRRLLGFMDGLAAGDYSYMPITIGDAVQGASLEMMTNSAKYVGGKVALTVAGGAIGSIVAPGIGTAIGASIGMMISNLGADAYMLYDAYTADPDTFWNKYVDNIKDVARGADSNQEPNATGWRRWLSEINTGMSYIGMGGKEAVHETWDDVVGAVPEYTICNMFGNVVRSLTAGLPMGVGGSTMSYVIDQALNDGLREAARNVGITNDIKQAAALGSIYGFGAGLTAGAFAKLALADKGIFKKLKDVSPFLGNPLANSAEAALGQLSYDFIVDVVDPTQDRTIEDYGINTGFALAMGYGMSALPAMWSKIRTKNLENAVKNIDVPTQKDVPTAKESIENKVVVTESRPTEGEAKQGFQIIEDTEFKRGKALYKTEAFEKLQKRRLPEQYRDAANSFEVQTIEKVIGETNKQADFPNEWAFARRFDNSQQELTWLKRKAFSYYDALTPEEKTDFVSKMGYESEAAFFAREPLSDIMQLDTVISDMYNIPVYNPNTPALSNQQYSDIRSGAIKLINNGMSPETAVKVSYARTSRTMPDESEVSKILGTFPEVLHNLDAENRLTNKIEDFIRANEQEAYNSVVGKKKAAAESGKTAKPESQPKPKAEPKPKQISDTDMVKLFGNKSVVKDNVFVAENNKFSMINDKDFAISDKMRTAQTDTVEGTLDKVIEKTQESFYNARENRQNNVEVVKEGDIFGKNEYTNLKIDGKPKYVLQKWWNFAKKMMGKDFDVWTAKGEPNKIYFSKGNKICYVELETARSKFNERK